MQNLPDPVVANGRSELVGQLENDLLPYALLSPEAFGKHRWPLDVEENYRGRPRG